MDQTLGSREPVSKVRAIPCEVYSRVVGYYRPVDSWNKGKREEYKDRHQMNKAEISPGRLEAKSAGNRQEDKKERLTVPA